jgi:hypothetical protein
MAYWLDVYIFKAAQSILLHSVQFRKYFMALCCHSFLSSWEQN